MLPVLRMDRSVLKITIFSVGLFLLLAGCAKEVYNVEWKGVVADGYTGRPVAHARIFASASYQENIDQTSQINQYTLSDEYGRFKLVFPRAFGLTLKVTAPGYLSGVQYKLVKHSSLEDTIYVSPLPFNASLIVRKMDFSVFSSDIPFVREVQIYDGTKKNNGRKNSRRWGFDFLSGRNTLNLDSADIWVEINEQSGKIMLLASPEGGIFPVLDSSANDFLLGYTQAPEKGYQKSYILKGDEAGFFVLCRNGVNVAKMIPEDKICVLSYTTSDGKKVEEKGIRFNYLFQPDLKNRLSFPVSASVLNIAEVPDSISN
jgi:hypothetical protein